MAHLDEQFVAGRMSERVVHILEAVEVEQRDGARSVAAVAGEQPSQLLLQQQAVRQSGQLVVVRQPAQLLFRLLAGGDVLVDPGHAAYGSVRIAHGRGGHPHVDQRAVLALSLQLHIPDRFALEGAVEQPLRHRFVAGGDDLGALPQHLGGRVAEDLLCAPAPEHEAALVAGADDRHRRGIDHGRERILGFA